MGRKKKSSNSGAASASATEGRRSERKSGRPRVQRRAGLPEPFETAPPKALWWIVALAAALRLPFLGRFGLWLDEIYVRREVLKPLAENLDNYTHLVHYLSIKPFLSVSGGEFFLRLPSALFGILAVALGFFAARRLFSERAGLLFAFFIAVGTYFINYSIDANYYSHMMFWTVAALYAFARMFTARSTYHSFLCLLAIVVIGGLCFFVHPFSAIFFACLIAFLFVHLATTPRYFESLPFYGRVFGSWPKRLAFLTALLATPALLIWILAGEEARNAWRFLGGRFLGMISFGKTPTNVELNWEFFVNYFTRTGPGFFYSAGRGFWVLTGAAVLFALFLTGVALSARRNPLFPVLFLLPFAASFGLLSSLDARRFFEIRYFSYLVPIYWLGIAAAVGAAIEKLLARPSVDASPWRRRLVALGPPGLIFSFSLMHALYLLTVDAANWDGVMPAFVERAKPGETLFYTNWAEADMLPYYLEKHGARGIETRRLNYTPNRGVHPRVELEDFGFRNDSFWFLSSWLDIRSRPALEWARKNLEEVAYSPSFFGQTMDARLFRWNWGGRFVLPPRILRYRARPEAQSPDGAFAETFLFDRAMKYEFRVQLAEPELAASARIELAGKSATLAPSRRDSGSILFSGSIEAPEGPQSLAVETDPKGLSVEAIEIIPRFPNGDIEIPGWRASRLHPSDYTWIVEEEGETALVQKRSTFAIYDFSLAESGNYWIGVTAKHDKPRPILIEIRINDDSAGVLTFLKGDESWEELGLPVMLASGDHQIALRFVNEGDVAVSEPELDKDAFIRGIRISPLAAGAAIDHELAYGPGGPATLYPMEPGEDGRPIGGDWIYAVDPGEELWPRVAHDPEVDRNVFSATLQRQTPGMYLMGPATPLVAAGPDDLKIVYYSAMLRVKDLENHSVNLLTRFLDETGRPMVRVNEKGKDYVVETEANKEGITRNSDWIRIVCFGRAPDEAAAYRPCFVVYSNSRKTSTKLGKVFFTDMRWEGR